jgi:hypothetical protein
LVRLTFFNFGEYSFGEFALPRISVAPKYFIAKNYCNVKFKRPRVRILPSSFLPTKLLTGAKSEPWLSCLRGIRSKERLKTLNGTKRSDSISGYRRKKVPKWLDIVY